METGWYQTSTDAVKNPHGISRLPQYIAALIANLGGFYTGLCLGWTSPAEIPLIRDGQYGYTVSQTQFAWVSSLMSVGALLAAPGVGWLGSSVGRKTSILILCVPAAVGFALIAWAYSVALLCLGRFLTGVATGGFSVIVPLFTSEFAEVRIRGSLGIFFQLQLNCGILFTYIVGSLVDVFWLSFICMLIPVVYFALVIFLPESPIYYLEKEDEKSARISLQWFRGNAYNIDFEFVIMQQNIQEVKAAQLTFLEAFSSKAAKMALIVSCGLMAFQQLCGINIIIFYTNVIFKDAGSTLNSNVETIITGVVNLGFTYVSSFIIDRLGRRPLLLLSDFGMAVSTFVIGLYFLLKDKHYNIDTISWVPIVFVCIFIITYALGFGPIPWVFLGEVFPRQIAGYAASVACVVCYVGAFLVTNFFNDLSLLVGTEGAFFVYSVLSIIGTLFVFFLVPETKNKSLEEVIKELES